VGDGQADMAGLVGCGQLATKASVLSSSAGSSRRNSCASWDGSTASLAG
jgi:hypothetical protein